MKPLDIMTQSARSARVKGVFYVSALERISGTALVRVRDFSGTRNARDRDRRAPG